MSLKIKPVIIVVCSLVVLALVAGFFVLYDPFDIFNRQDTHLDENSVNVPILMYHHFADEGNPGTIVSAEMFENQLVALKDAGYNTISFDELCDYVFNGADLPERPLIITIDDGYLSVYETAFPILKKLDMKATAFIIGVSHGKSFYKDTEHPIIPRFGDAEAIEMVESGIISIQTHSYDMHQHEPYETGPFRKGVLQMAEESDEDYIMAFTADFKRASDQLEAMLGSRPFVFSYPFGVSSDLSESLLRDLGIKVTLTIVADTNTVVRYSPDSLFSLNRFNVPGDMTPEALLDLVGN